MKTACRGKSKEEYRSRKIPESVQITVIKLDTHIHHVRFLYKIGGITDTALSIYISCLPRLWPIGDKLLPFLKRSLSPSATCTLQSSTLTGRCWRTTSPARTSFRRFASRHPEADEITLSSLSGSYTVSLSFSVFHSGI